MRSESWFPTFSEPFCTISGHTFNNKRVICFFHWLRLAFLEYLFVFFLVITHSWLFKLNIATGGDYVIWLLETIFFFTIFSRSWLVFRIKVGYDSKPNYLSILRSNKYGVPWSSALTVWAFPGGLLAGWWSYSYCKCSPSRKISLHSCSHFECFIEIIFFSHVILSCYFRGWSLGLITMISRQ